MLILPCTIRTESLDHIVYGSHLESLGQCCSRDFCFAETKSAVTAFTIEVDMLVVVAVVIVTAACLVAEGSTAILYRVNKMMVE